MKLNLPVILLKDIVLLPQEELKLEFEDEINKNAIDESEFFHDRKVFVITDISKEENIVLSELVPIGTMAKIVRKLELPNGNIRVILKGIKRSRVIEYLLPSKDSLESIISIDSNNAIKEDIKIKLLNKLYAELNNYIDKVPNASNSILSQIESHSDLDCLTDMIVNYLSFDLIRKLEYLNEFNCEKRVEMLLSDIYKKEQLSSFESNIDIKVKKELDDDQKKFYIKEKIKLLQNELGEISLKEEEINRLRSLVLSLNASDEIKNKINHEIDKYENMPQLSPEISIVRNYIELMIQLPWNTYDKNTPSLNKAKQILDENHYGLDEVKTRIIEFLALQNEFSNINSPIICLVGPPGVGKTTFAYTIAKSIGRKFVKISLGGVDDESIIKGHIRTYIGSTCGKIIDGIKRCKTSNPVFLIDEIDKMTVNHKGDPASALLEVLDSNQNAHFIDNYLEEEYDLSKVMFITTANNINEIPEPLKDRLEIIDINGYSELEKIEITKNYLIPKLCKEYGIKNIKISDENILEIIRYYTHESGLRELQRLIEKIIRKVVTEKVINNGRIKLNIKNIEDYLGNRIYEKDIITSEIGLVNGMAYTQIGGDIIPIETNYYEGDGNIIITGSVGEVMNESVKVALTYIKSNYKMFNIDRKIFTSDIHVNIPAISVKKEGPSAGVAITTSIISALTNLKISKQIAMTGEITLRGNILKVGSIKEKIIGAYINNVDTVFIPYSNMNDIKSLPDEIKNKMNFIFVKNYEEIYNYLKR